MLWNMAPPHHTLSVILCFDDAWCHSVSESGQSEDVDINAYLDLDRERLDTRRERERERLRDLANINIIN